MKSLEQLNQARTILASRIPQTGNREQQILLTGMLNALVWAADGTHKDTVERILAGEPFGYVPGPQLAPNTLQLPYNYSEQRVQDAFEELSNGFEYAGCPDDWKECNAARTLAAVLVYWTKGIDIT